MRKGSGWARLTTFGSALEADVAVSRLEAAEIPAISRGNDIVGIFGPGFQGVTAKGVDVLVPEAALADARSVLDLDDVDGA
jgi:Putative prokaryotic signal transducing protein